MHEWKWSKVDHLGLARYVTPQAINLLRLSINRLDYAKSIDKNTGPPLSKEGRKKVVEEIYNALISKNIQYDIEQFQESASTQIIRKPTEIIEAPGVGTCLDLAVLFSGLCLGYELLPLLIVLEGHVLVAISLCHDLSDWWKDRDSKKLFESGTPPNEKAKELLNLCNQNKYIAIECTGFAQSQRISKSVPEGIGRTEDGFLTFERAVAAGCEQLQRQEDRPPKFALDIATAHYEWGIEPVYIPLTTLAPTAAISAEKKQLFGRKEQSMRTAIERYLTHNLAQGNRGKATIANCEFDGSKVKFKISIHHYHVWDVPIAIPFLGRQNFSLEIYNDRVVSEMTFNPFDREDIRKTQVFADVPNFSGIVTFSKARICVSLEEIVDEILINLTD